MGCPDDNQLAAFVEGGLSHEERAELERHVDGCAACRALLAGAAMDATRREGRGEPAQEAFAQEAPAEDSQPGVLRHGRMVDHFYVLRQLGEGGMGRVYLARDTQLGRRVALKLIHPTLASSARAVKMFRREARAMARINHPNIVAIHSVGEHDGVPYVALEYVRGDTLRERYDDRPAAPIEALRIGLGLAEGLAEAHRHGIVHRDLKPSNVLLGPNDRPRITDFGLADFVRDRSEPVPSQTDPLTCIDTAASSPSDGGTPSYMAPEQWRGEVATGATDIWALGVILWEMLSGERLFRGKNEIELAGQICGREPVPRVAERSRVSAEVNSFVAACLQRTAADRPTAQQAVESLRQCLDRLELAPYIASAASAQIPQASALGDEAAVPEPLPSSPALYEAPTLRQKRKSTVGAEQGSEARRPSDAWLWETSRLVIAAVVVLFVLGLGAVALGTAGQSQPAAAATPGAGALAERLAAELSRRSPAVDTPRSDESASGAPAERPEPSPRSAKARSPKARAEASAKPTLFDHRW